MIFKPSSLHKFFFTYICPRFYGGAPPSPPSNTTQTVNQNSIPAELLPYTRSMMGAAENQVYTKDDAGKITGLQPYKPYSTNAADYVAPFSPLQQKAQTSAFNLASPDQFTTATPMATQAGMGQLYSAGQAQGYGAQGAGTASKALGYGAQGVGLGLGAAQSASRQAGAQIAQAGGYGSQGSFYGAQAAGQAGQGYEAGAQYAQQATDPNSVSAYMSPYMQNVMEQQGRELNRNYDISGAQQQGQATQAGAFGGSREALMAAENDRNRNMALNKMQAEGMQNAYTAANANQQFGANLGIQGLNAGTNAMQAGMQGAQVGLQGVQAQTAASNMKLQGAQVGLQGIQTGLQGVQGAQQAAQTGLQGVQAAQAGYTGAGQTAGTLANIGQQQLAADTSIIGTQGQVGAQQQAQQQQAIDQSILDYKNAQQYPYMQLGTMSNLIRGIPMTNQTTTQYQAQPTTGSQIGGALATGLGAYAALKAKGGAIKDKGYAKGGIVGYKDRGYVEESMLSKLEDLDKTHLQTIIQKNVSPVQTGLAKEVLATKLAKGGIVAFANKEEEVKDKMPDLLGDLTAQKDELEARIKKQEDIKKSPIRTDVAPIMPVQAATLGPMTTDTSLKNMALNQAEGFQPPMPASGIAAIQPPTVSDAVKATPFNLDTAMADQQQDVEKLRVDAGRSEDELIAEDRKRREEQLGPDTATAEYRKKIMDERANAPDEARRQMGMRLMEFGANWASTPGAPLVAGMRALKDGLPGVMEDTKANKKAMKDIDASIYQLDHADRLEQMGYLDRAVAKKEKAQELFMKASPQVIDAAVKKEQLMQQEEANKADANYKKGVLANQGAELAQRASQFAVTSAQPTAAGMKEQAIQAIMKEKDVPYGTAYGQVEEFGSTAKDPALGYRVAMAKTKLDKKADIYSAALGAEAKQKAYEDYQIANKEFETLQRAFDPTGEYGTTPPPSLGPNVNKGGSGLSDEDLLNKYASKTN